MINSYGIIAYRVIEQDTFEYSLVAPFEIPYCFECRQKLNNPQYSFLTKRMYKRSKDIEFLLVNRKNSHSYIDILRGKWKNKIHVWLDELICEERYRIMKYSFRENWNATLWSYFTLKQFYRYGEFLKASFPYLSKNKDGKNTSQHHLTTEFGFPKGRLDRKTEDKRECAIREFCEETGYTRKALHFPHGEKTFTEAFHGTDGIHYIHTYWLAEIKQSCGPPRFTRDHKQFAEIKNMGWFSQSQCNLLFRNYDLAKKNVLSECCEFLQTKDQQ